MDQYWVQYYLVYISDLDEGTQSLLSKFADDITLRGEADTAECCAAIQKIPNRLKKLARMNLFKIKKGKQKILYVGWNNSMHQYRLEAGLLESSSSGRYLGLLVDNKLI